MSLTYAIFHWFVHLTLPFIYGYWLGLDVFGYTILFLVTFAIDIDHIFLLRKHGIRRSYFLRTVTEFKKPRRYPFHHLVVVLASGILTAALLYMQRTLQAVVIGAIFIHLTWDFFEDVVIFNMGIKHWM